MAVNKHSLHLRYFIDDTSVTAQQHLNKINELLSRTSTYGNRSNGEVELCYHLIVETESEERFEAEYMERLVWLLSGDRFNAKLRKHSKFLDSLSVIEIGPHLAFPSAFSTNAVSVFNAAGIYGVQRLELSKRYSIDRSLNCCRDEILPLIQDEMMQCEYNDTVSFENFQKPKQFYQIDTTKSKDSLRLASIVLGLNFDDDDIDYYYNLFANVLQRNPTDVELHHLAQANNERNLHALFKGKLIIDGKEREDSLFQSIQNTQNYSNRNNLVSFTNDSSVIRGFKTHSLKCLNPVVVSEMDFLPCIRHIVHSAEIYNLPIGNSCTFSSAAVGVGKSIRKIHVTGRGAHEIAGIIGYSVGDLHLEESESQCEQPSTHPQKLPSPKYVLIEASNGASDYSNRFGQPVICGFARTFSQNLPNGDHCEYLKPMMFSGGIGAIDDLQVRQLQQAWKDWLVKIGGPTYRISFDDDVVNAAQLPAVSRYDPEMEQKLHRLIRSCIEFGDENPIMSIYEQGTSGNGNVLQQLIDSKYGAVIETNKFEVGDPTVSVRELWCLEYQESDAALVDPKSVKTLEKVAEREKCNISLVGRLNYTETVTVLDNTANVKTPPLCLPTTMVERSPKNTSVTSAIDVTKPLVIPSIVVKDILSSVLRLPSVASKRYLTNKVDRSVTGLIAQQQCVGPLQTPVADVGVVALSHWDIVGAAVAVGEQPIKGLVSPEAGARMSLAEALTNLVFAPITSRKDIKCSGSWMWTTKFPGEDARMVRACEAVCEAMKKVGVATDSNTNSPSLPVQINNEAAKAPATFVVSAYAPCTNITKVVTPDLKGPVDQTPTHLIYVRFGNNGLVNRLGGTALAQCLSQVGAATCDVEDFEKFGKAFDIVQELIKEDRILSGHDVSDGGLVTCALEMAIAGNRTTILQLMFLSGTLENLFAEEAGVILEVEDREVQDILDKFGAAEIFATDIGFATEESGPNAMVMIKMNFTEILQEPVSKIRTIWEETSNQLEMLQTNPKCVAEQKLWLDQATNPTYKADFDYCNPKINFKMQRMLKPYSVAIVREEGSNGDREMAAAFYLAGFAVFDVTTKDFLNSQFSLKLYNGIAFVGGFSYGDVFGAAKGWSTMIMYHEKIREELENFRHRPDTFSLGVCNGCQLMTLLGWIGTMDETNERVVQLQQNDCGRFQSSFDSVKITKSPSIFFTGMEDSILGIWSAHGEGKFCFKNEKYLDELEANCLVPIHYCDATGVPTMSYPQNPSGSTRAVAAITSPDGRHLAIMPHPERSFLSWQWPYYPMQWKKDCFNSSPWDENYMYNNSPWMRMFLNAYDWTHKNVGF